MVQPTILRLVSIRFIPSNGFGRLHYYHSFKEANKALPSLIDNYLPRNRDLFIYFEAEWQGAHFYSDTISFSDSLNSNPSFLQNYIQECLEDLLMLPNANTPEDMLISQLSSPGWQTEYLKIQSGSYHLYESILLFGEGIDSEAYLKKVDRIESVFKTLKEHHPLIKDFFKSARAFLLELEDVPNRTKYFKERIKKLANKHIYHGFSYAAVDNIAKVSEIKLVLKNLLQQIKDELNIPDERFTVFGKDFYRLLPYDYQELTSDIYQTTPLNAFQIVDFNDRLEATKSSNRHVITERSSQREIFYTIYKRASKELYANAKDNFSHLDISKKTYQLLLTQSLSKQQIKNMFNLYDPFAVNLPKYSDLIVK